FIFFFQAEDGIRDFHVTGVQTCALPIYAWSKSRIREPSRSGYRSFFFPLDGVRNWNRLYGPRGLHQHQSVVPEDAAREAVPALLDRKSVVSGKRGGDGWGPHNERESDVV